MSTALAHQLAEAITTPDDAGIYQQFTAVDWLAHATDDEVSELLQQLHLRFAADRHLNERLLVAALRELVRRIYSGGSRRWKALSAAARDALVSLYGALGGQYPARYLLLQCLAASRGREDLLAFADLAVTDPPTDATAAAISFGPLFQSKSYDAEALFPRLLDAMGNAAVAPAVMDLANFVTREELLEEHPGTVRKTQLTEFLGSLIRQLERVEERPAEMAGSDQALAAMVRDAIALAVSLCDALALIGDRAAIGKLYQALELRHRRLRTEAAAALARLGEERGRDVLVSLAAEPVTRLRVLAYAEELGFEDQLDQQFTTAEARAESELALWLAQPSQIGFPPSRLELVDSQTLYWPGYDEPVEAFLFRFAYETDSGEYSNIGIAGPLCHAFEADLADLPPDDIFAVFAGWHVEHDDVYEIDATQLTPEQRLDLVRLERRLHDEGYEDLQLVKVGVFFGERALVCRAVREGHPGIAVGTQDEIQWHPATGRMRPLGPHEAYCLYKGRKLLRTFNP